MTPIERFQGPTPAGGAYADVITTGEQVEIIEYDQDGYVIARTYGTTSSPPADELLLVAQLTGAVEHLAASAESRCDT